MRATLPGRVRCHKRAVCEEDNVERNDKERREGVDRHQSSAGDVPGSKTPAERTEREKNRMQNEGGMPEQARLNALDADREKELEASNAELGEFGELSEAED